MVSEHTHGAIIDAAVYPQPKHADDIRAYMDSPWSDRPFPGPDRYYYPLLTGEFLEDAQSDGLPGSDPARMDEMLFERNGADRAVLLPLTRGLLPDIDLGSAVCTGTNRWLADTWLDSYNRRGRYAGVIRVNPQHPEAAVQEIESWASHPNMVAVGVPLQTRSPYGQRQYFPVWEAAVANGLPVIVKLDGGSGIDYWPTAVGYPHHFIEYATLAPINYAYHLVSFITEGVFERLPDLRIVFADGGHDMLAPLVWRMDKIWRPTRTDTPWMTIPPWEYVRRHVRFCARRLEGPRGSGDLSGWHRLNATDQLLMFASSAPYHDTVAPDEVLDPLPAEIRGAVAKGNAEGLYFAVHG
jgi:predicted TIM-barrel fold metal-dependent hydrolase